MKKLLFSGLIVLALIAGVYTMLRLTEASAKTLPELKNGDLIFQTIHSSQTLAIMAASGSPYTHTGIIKMIGGKPFVVEAVGPVREIALDKWIEQGIGKRIAVLRKTDLSDEDANKILTQAKTYYGRPYDFFFLLDKEKIYCSELLYYAYLEGAGITLGKKEKLKDLNFNNAAVQKLIEARWQNYPPCKNAGVKDMDSCIPIVLEQDMVTPESIASDAQLEMVFSNYGLQQ